jgi:hypothetical protein
MSKKCAEVNLMAGWIPFLVLFVTKSLASGSFDHRKDIVRVSNQFAVEPLTVTQVLNGTYSVGHANLTTTPTTKMKTKTSKREKKKVASLRIKPPIQGTKFKKYFKCFPILL